MPTNQQGTDTFIQIVKEPRFGGIAQLPELWRANNGVGFEHSQMIPNKDNVSVNIR